VTHGIAQQPASGRNLSRLYVALGVAGLLGSVALAWAPLDLCFSHYLIDDAFYYLTAARRLATGSGATLDGLHPTNGFHPLWLLLLTGISRAVGPHPFLVLRLALTLAALAFGASAVVLYRSLRKLTDPTSAAAAFALVGLNYRLSSLALGGMETALAGFLVLLVVCRSALMGQPRNVVSAALWGALLGLTILARFDALLLSALLLLAGLVEGPGTLRTRLGRSAATVAGIGVVLLPWFLFSLRATGTLLPRSGEAIQVAWTSPWEGAVTLKNRALVLAQVLHMPANDLCNILGLSPMVHRKHNLYLGEEVLGLVALLLLWAAFRKPSRNVLRRLFWLPPWVILHVAYYAAFGFPRVRYFYSLVCPAVLFTVWVLYAGTRRTMPLFALRFAPLVLLLTSGIAGVQAWSAEVGDFIYQGLGPTLFTAARWVAANTEPGAIVGAFNGGYMSYFSGRTTVNLDGCMNQGALDALRARRLGPYIDHAGILYLVDLQAPLIRMMDDFSGDSDWRNHYRRVFMLEGFYLGGRSVARLVVFKKLEDRTLLPMPAF
jgi:hypothetical protein